MHNITFSSDDKFIISGSGKSIILWNVKTGQKIRTFEGHTECVKSVALSHDDKYIISGSCDKTIKLWNLKTGFEIRTFEGHTECVNSVAFSPNGKYIVSGSTDDNVKVWSLEPIYFSNKYKQLPQFKNFSAKISKKNGKPYKGVEVAGKNILFITNDLGEGNFNSPKTPTKITFKKGSKKYTKKINFHKDSIYNVNLKLHKPSHTHFEQKITDLETLVYESIKEKYDIELLNAFVKRFPNGKYNSEIKNKIEALRYNEAIWKNSTNIYKQYLIYYPKGKHVSQIERAYDNKLYTDAQLTNTMQAYKDYIDKSSSDFHKSDAEVTAYKIAQSKNTKSAYREYKNLFSSSSYASNASSGINKINKQVAKKEEDRIYKNAQNGDISNCDTYLNTYSSGRYVSQVQNRNKAY